jgi:hypothetical protein
MSRLHSSPYLHFPEEHISFLSSSVLAVGVSYNVRLHFVSRKHLFAIIMPLSVNVVMLLMLLSLRWAAMLFRHWESKNCVYYYNRNEMVCGDCQVVWQEHVFLSWSNEDQRIKSCWFLCCTANCKAYI